MTAEIIVLNREGVAMATDSAITSSLGDIDKISSSANKLFSLSDKHPVGIMIYGNSSLMGVPWETIIKVYRSAYLRSTGFATIDEYARHFISFLCYENVKFHSVAEGNYIQDFVEGVLSSIKRVIFKNIEVNDREGREISALDLQRIVNRVIDDAYGFYHNLDTSYITVEQSKSVFRRYRKDIKDHIDVAFSMLAVDSDYRSKLYELLIEAFSKFILDDVSSGVVIAGFGENEFLPVVKALNVEGIVRFHQNNTELEILKYLEDGDKSSSADVDSAVIAYAQEDMACRFVEGVDPEYLEGEDEAVGGLFKDYAHKVVSELDRYDEREKRRILQKLSRYGKRVTREFGKDMKEFRRIRFVDPTIEAVGRLSKNELGLMAEALVYVTSLKRKISAESETVAEPIDVAVISKGDGFVWIKRKHYFEPKLNPVYFMKRHKEVADEDYDKPERRTQSSE
ncbi:MAG: hypothetical protein ABSF21_03670 [Dehalococcoidia bacterium]